MRLSPERFPGRGDDPFDLDVTHLRKEREADDLCGPSFRHGESARPEPEVTVGALEVDRDGVVHLGADSVVFQRSAETVPAGDAHDEEMLDGRRRGEFWGGGQGKLGEGGSIVGRDGPTALVPTRQVREFGAEDGGLEFIEPGVEAEFDVVIAVRLPVVPEVPEPGLEGSGGSGYGSSVSQGSEILARIEAPAREVAESSGGGTVAGRPMGLCGILDQGNPPGPGQPHDGFQRCAASVEVDRHDGPDGTSPVSLRGGQLPLHRARVEEPMNRVDIGEAGHGTGLGDPAGRGHRRIGSREDAIAIGDPEGAEREVDGVGSVGHPGRPVGAEKVGELRLEPSALLAEYEPATIEHAPDGRIEFGAERGYLGAQIADREDRTRAHER